MMGKKVFDNPKSINLLKKIIKFTTSDNDLILDFFAGSGSTGEAVIQVNNEENTNRKFILCEQLDYVEKVTATRLQKCLTNESFIYFELAKLNESFTSKIKEADSKSQLQNVWSEMNKNAVISWRVNNSKIKDTISSLSDNEIEDFKAVLYETLDKNQFYIPYTELNDSEYGLSTEDKELSIQFFNQKL